MMIDTLYRKCFGWFVIIPVLLVAEFCCDCIYYLLLCRFIVKHGLTSGPWSNGMGAISIVLCFYLIKFARANMPMKIKLYGRSFDGKRCNSPMTGDFIVVLLLAILVTLFELVVGLIFLHFDVRLWNYKKHVCNYYGIISLSSSSLYFLLCMLLYYFAYPILTVLKTKLEKKYNNVRFRRSIGVLCLCFYCCYITDYCIGIRNMVRFYKVKENVGKRFIPLEIQRPMFDILDKR